MCAMTVGIGQQADEQADEQANLANQRRTRIKGGHESKELLSSTTQTNTPTRIPHESANRHGQVMVERNAISGIQSVAVATTAVATTYANIRHPRRVWSWQDGGW